MRVPYLYLVASGLAANIIPIYGNAFDGTIAETTYAYFKLVDANGLPVTNSRTTFATSSGALLIAANPTTDSYGIGAAEYALGTTPGAYTITANAGGQQFVFTATARAVPSSLRSPTPPPPTRPLSRPGPTSRYSEPPSATTRTPLPPPAYLSPSTS